MPKVCLRYAKVCSIYAVDMSATYLRYAGTCIKYTQDMPKLCLRYAIDMPEIYLRYAQDMPFIYEGISSSLCLPLGREFPRIEYSNITRIANAVQVAI